MTNMTYTTIMTLSCNLFVRPVVIVLVNRLKKLFFQAVTRFKPL